MRSCDFKIGYDLSAPDLGGERSPP